MNYFYKIWKFIFFTGIIQGSHDLPHSLFSPVGTPEVSNLVPTVVPAVGSLAHCQHDEDTLSPVSRMNRDAVALEVRLHQFRQQLEEERRRNQEELDDLSARMMVLRAFFAQQRSHGNLSDPNDMGDTLAARIAVIQDENPSLRVNPITRVPSLRLGGSRSSSHVSLGTSVPPSQRRNSSFGSEIVQGREPNAARSLPPVGNRMPELNLIYTSDNYLGNAPADGPRGILRSPGGSSSRRPSSSNRVTFVHAPGQPNSGPGSAVCSYVQAQQRASASGCFVLSDRLVDETIDDQDGNDSSGSSQDRAIEHGCGVTSTRNP